VLGVLSWITLKLDWGERELKTLGVYVDNGTERLTE
jgi:hypothetical protein